MLELEKHDLEMIQHLYFVLWNIIN